MAVRALTEVFEIPHPGALMYKAFDKRQRTILVPTLGLKHEEPAPPRAMPREDTVEGLRSGPSPSRWKTSRATGPGCDVTNATLEMRQ